MPGLSVQIGEQTLVEGVEFFLGEPAEFAAEAAFPHLSESRNDGETLLAGESPDGEAKRPDFGSLA